MTSSGSAPIEDEAPFLVRFFDPQIAAEDYRSRTLDDIINFSDRQLESSHDYIQTLFPLPEESAFNWSASVVDEDVFQAFRSRDDLRKSFARGFTRIMAFYGFDASNGSDGKVDLTRSADHLVHFKNWVVRMDHNHLRITRIIRSLRVLGLESHADTFYRALQQVMIDFPNRIGQRSMIYWTRAAKRPLYLAPDENDDDAIDGPKFLLDFEAAREHATPDDTTETNGATDPVDATTADK